MTEMNLSVRAAVGTSSRTLIAVLSASAVALLVGAVVLAYCARNVVQTKKEKEANMQDTVT